MRKRQLLYTALFLFPACSGFAQQVKQTQYRVPVLALKDHNPVVLLEMDGPAASGGLQGVELELDKQTPAYLDAVSIWSLGKDTASALEAKLQKAKLLSTQPVKGNRRLTLTVPSAQAAAGQFYIVSVSLRTGAPINGFVGVSTKAVTIGSKRQTLPPATAQACQRIGIAVRQHWQDSVHTHRIPGLATANDGSLLAVYDARRDKGGDLQGDIDIGVSRSLDKGKTWLPMEVALDRKTWGNLPEKFNGISDACILVDKKTGTIFIAGLWMYGVLDKDGKWIEGLNENSKDWNHQWRDKGSQPGFDPKRTSQFLLTSSRDNGRTWSEPVNLTTLCKKESWWLWAPAPGAGITLRDGTLVFPTQGRDEKGQPFSNITYSKDGGKTWTTSKPAVNESTTENMAVELTDGSIMLNMRANSNRTDTSDRNGRAIAVTTDLGQTWTTHPTSHGALIEPTCMASIIRHDYTEKGKKRSILVFCNPDSKTARNRISLKISFDDGRTWPKTLLLDEKKGRGYSCLTSIDEQHIGVLYESSQADLVFQSISLRELLQL